VTSARWWLGLAVVVVASCGGDKPPTGPSGSATRISLIAPHPTLDVGESQQLSLVLTGPDGVGHAPEGPVTWRSSNDAVYAAWSGGLVVAVAPGQATITASADGKTADIVLRVEAGAGAVRHVQGRVGDYTLDAPLSGVSVVFVLDFDGPSIQTTTDGNGNYAVDLPTGLLSASVDGQQAGQVAVRIGGPAYRGDLIARAGERCMSRYGTVTDATTFQPLAGATVQLGSRTAVTGADGWYRIDLGCLDNPLTNFNTAFLDASHPGYRSLSRVVGRGIHSVLRLDVELQRL